MMVVRLRVAIAWGLVLFGTSWLAACASSNRYDGLRAIPAPAVQASHADAAHAGKPRLGIAFGGGGVRGFMHLGVLRALDEAGIHADVVSGTSAGAIAAALYASGRPLDDISAAVHAVSQMQLADLVLNGQGALNGQALAHWVDRQTAHRRIEEMPIALGVVVTDLTDGRALMVVEGPTGQAVQASASIPGAFVPVQSQGHVWVDGSVLSLVPVRFARALGADVVIGIDIYCNNAPALKGNALDTMYKTSRLQSCRLSAAEMAEADLLIRPDFEPTSAGSFAQRDEAIAAGYRATLAVLPDIRRRLGMTP